MSSAGGYNTQDVWRFQNVLAGVAGMAGIARV